MKECKCCKCKNFEEEERSAFKKWYKAKAFVKVGGPITKNISIILEEELKEAWNSALTTLQKGIDKENPNGKVMNNFIESVKEP